MMAQPYIEIKIEDGGPLRPRRGKGLSTNTTGLEKVQSHVVDINNNPGAAKIFDGPLTDNTLGFNANLNPISMNDSNIHLYTETLKFKNLNTNDADTQLLKDLLDLLLVFVNSDSNNLIRRCLH